jgi:hypothetical protein
VVYRGLASRRLYSRRGFGSVERGWDGRVGDFREGEDFGGGNGWAKGVGGDGGFRGKIWEGIVEACRCADVILLKRATMDQQLQNQHLSIQSALQPR